MFVYTVFRGSGNMGFVNTKDFFWGGGPRNQD